MTTPLSSPQAEPPICPHEIGDGFYRITAGEAARLAKHRLPEYGYEQAIEYAGHYYWLTQRVVEGLAIWTIRHTQPRSLTDGAISK